MRNRDCNLDYCNFAKTALMLLVLLCHSAAFFGGNWFRVLEPVQISHPLGLLSSWLGTFHVQGFTLISGYIFYFQKEEMGKYGDMRAFLWSKTKRLLVPYISVSVLWVIPLSSLFYDYSLSDICNAYFLGQAPAQLWFLLMLFNVFLIADLLFDKHFAWVAILLLFCAGNILPGVSPNVFQVFTAMKYILFFYVGYLIRKYVPNIPPRSMTKIGGLLFVCNVSLFAFREAFSFDGHIILRMVKSFVSNACELSGAIMAFFLLSSLAANSMIRKNIFFESLSKVSFPIYLFHQQIIYILLWSFAKNLNPFVMSMICFIGSLLMSWGIGILMNKSKLTRIIIGAK